MQSRPPTDPALLHLSYSKGITDAWRRIAREEGVKALWRGTGLSLTMAIRPAKKHTSSVYSL